MTVKIYAVNQDGKQLLRNVENIMDGWEYVQTQSYYKSRPLKYLIEQITNKFLPRDFE